MHRPGYKIAIMACVMAMGIAGCGTKSPSDQSSDRESRAVDASEAESLYKANCMACHGAELEGKVGPNLQGIGSSLTVKQITNQIMHGGSKMPGFEARLTDDEIETLANWLSSRK